MMGNHTVVIGNIVICMTLMFIYGTIMFKSRKFLEKISIFKFTVLAIASSAAIITLCVLAMDVNEYIYIESSKIFDQIGACR